MPIIDKNIDIHVDANQGGLIHEDIKNQNASVVPVSLGV